MIIVGIDPGIHGGIAILSTGERPHIHLLKVMPLTPQGNLDLDELRQSFRLYSPWTSRFWIENVHSMPGQGVVATFRFGRDYGSVLGVLAALELPVQQVTPQVWKKEIIGKRVKGKRENKLAAIDWVTFNFPEVDLIPRNSRVPHSGIADAICIAVYGIRKLAQEKSNE